MCIIAGVHSSLAAPAVDLDLVHAAGLQVAVDCVCGIGDDAAGEQVAVDGVFGIGDDAAGELVAFDGVFGFGDLAGCFSTSLSCCCWLWR